MDIISEIEQTAESAGHDHADFARNIDKKLRYGRADSIIDMSRAEFGVDSSDDDIIVAYCKYVDKYTDDGLSSKAKRKIASEYPDAASTLGFGHYI